MKRTPHALLLAGLVLATLAPAAIAQERIAPGSKVLWPAGDVP